MTAHIGTTSIDGTPISGADLARIEAEEKLHIEQQLSAVRVVASASVDAADCRTLLDMLGLDEHVVEQARARNAAVPPAPQPPRKRSAAA